MDPSSASWILSLFLPLILAYGAIQALWKVYRIFNLWEKEGLRVARFIRGRGGTGLAIGLAAILITVVALFLPWYSATVSHLGGSGAGAPTTQFIYVDGWRGFNISLFSSQGHPNSSGLVNIVSVSIPLALLFAVGLPLLLLDVVGVRSGKSLGRRFIGGAIALVIGFALMYASISYLPSILPSASSFLGGNPVPSDATGVLNVISSQPLSGSAQETLPVYGPASVTWGFGLGAYLLLLAAALRIVGGAIMSTAPSLSPRVAAQGPPSSEPTRRLAAIMFTDIVGYTALTQSDEKLAMKVLEQHRKLLRPIFPKHGGREVKTIGDAFLVEFHSALEATECAVEMQQVLHDHNETAKDKDKVKLKVGIHVGDVIHKEGDVYGDAVNIASRIEPLAVGGGVCISEQVYDQVRNKIPYKLVKLEPKDLKNVSFQIDTYRVVLPWEAPPTPDDATSGPPAGH